MHIHTHSVKHTHTHAYIRHVPPPVPLSVLFSVFFMGPARQADAIFSTRGKSQRPVLVSLSPPHHLDPAPQSSQGPLARSGAPSPPRITRLHPPNAEQEGRQSCGMRVQRGACQILCPFDSFTSLLWITWRLLNINKRRLRGSNSPQSTCYTHTHTHTRAQRLTCNTLAASFIFLTRPLAPTSMQGVHIAPQIPQITVSLCVCVRTAAGSWSSDSHICSPPKKVLSEEKTDKLRRRGDNERERHVKTNREREEKCVKRAEQKTRE